MKILYFYFAALVLFFLIIKCFGEINFEEDLDLDLEDSEETMITAQDALDLVVEMVKYSKPAEQLQKLAKKLSTMGPALMGVGAGLCVIAAFFPEEDSEELKAIKEGFENLNKKMDVLTYNVLNLESVVKISAAQASYTTSVSMINENHQVFMEAVKNKDVNNYKYFAINFKNTYKMAATNIYDAFLGSNGAFGFNLVQLYSESVKCNPIKVTNFCVMGIELVSKGLTCESAYLGMKNFTAQVRAMKKMWAAKMETLTNQCHSVVSKCEAEWETRTQKEFVATHTKEMSDIHDEFAGKIIKSVKEVAPQRKWFALVYDDAGGFGEHCFSSYYKVSKIWNEKDKDVSLFSADRDVVSKERKKTWKAEMENLSKSVSDKEYCNKDWKYKNSRNQSRSLVEIIRKKYMRGVVYVVDEDKDPGCKKSGGLIFQKLVKWGCEGQLYKLYIFE